MQLCKLRAVKMRQLSFAVVFVLLGLCLARPENIGADIDELYSGMIRYVYKTLVVRHYKLDIVKMRRIDCLLSSTM